MAQCIGQSSHYRRKEHHKLQKQFVAECKLIQNMKFSRTTLYCTLLFVINTIYRYKRVVMNLHSGVRMILHTKLLLASVYIIGRCFLYVGAKFSPVGKRHKCVCVLLHQPIYISVYGELRDHFTTANGVSNDGRNILLRRCTMPQSDGTPAAYFQFRFSINIFLL